MTEFKPIEFTAMDWYKVSGRGWCASIDGKTLPEFLWDAGNLTNMVVKVDGELYQVLGVEQFAIARSPMGFKGQVRHYEDNFGILLKPLTPTGKRIPQEEIDEWKAKRANDPPPRQMDVVQYKVKFAPLGEFGPEYAEGLKINYTNGKLTSKEE